MKRVNLKKANFLPIKIESDGKNQTAAPPSPTCFQSMLLLHSQLLGFLLTLSVAGWQGEGIDCSQFITVPFCCLFSSHYLPCASVGPLQKLQLPSGHIHLLQNKVLLRLQWGNQLLSGSCRGVSAGVPGPPLPSPSSLTLVFRRLFLCFSHFHHPHLLFLCDKHNFALFKIHFPWGTTVLPGGAKPCPVMDLPNPAENAYVMQEASQSLLQLHTGHWCVR